MKVRKIALMPIRFYQKYLSPLKRYPACKYSPCCSQYAYEAIERRGILAGSVLALWRILRCNPFSRGGFDPVPDKGFARVKISLPPEGDIPPYDSEKEK